MQVRSLSWSRYWRKLRAAYYAMDADTRARFLNREAYEQRLRDREHIRALEELQARKAAGLPELPSENEIAAKTVENMTSRLGDSWFISDGLLYHRSWRIQRISPGRLVESHYLDL